MARPKTLDTPTEIRLELGQREAILSAFRITGEGVPAFVRHAVAERLEKLEVEMFRNHMTRHPAIRAAVGAI